jgi:hypothetical protein
MGQTKDQLSRRRRKLTPLPTAPVLTSEQTEVAKNNLSQQLQGQNQSALKENLQNTTVGRVKEASVAPGQSIQPQAVQAPKPQPLVIKPKDNNVLSSEQATAERNRIATETQTALTQNHPEEIKKYNLAQMNKMIKAAGEEGEAKRQETEDKRRRRIALFNALGDGISALSNLYFTSKGAPSVQYDPRGSLSARQQARWDAIDANRKAEEEKAYVRQQQAMDKTLKEAKERRDEQRQAEIDRKNDEYRQKQLDQKAQYQAQNLDLQRYRADLEAQAKKESFQNKKELEEYKQGQLNARANVKQGGSSSSSKPIPLGNGEYVDVSKSKWDSNSELISNVFNALPEDVKAEAMKKYGKEVGYEQYQISAAQMRSALGEYLQHPSAEAARQIVRERGVVAQDKADSGKKKTKASSLNKSKTIALE